MNTALDNAMIKGAFMELYPPIGNGDHFSIVAREYFSGKVGSSVRTNARTHHDEATGFRSACRPLVRAARAIHHNVRRRDVGSARSHQLEDESCNTVVGARDGGNSLGHVAVLGWSWPAAAHVGYPPAPLTGESHFRPSLRVVDDRRNRIDRCVSRILEPALSSREDAGDDSARLLCVSALHGRTRHCDGLARLTIRRGIRLPRLLPGGIGKPLQRAARHRSLVGGFRSGAYPDPSVAHCHRILS